MLEKTRENITEVFCILGNNALTERSDKHSIKQAEGARRPQSERQKNSYKEKR